MHLSRAKLLPFEAYILSAIGQTLSQELGALLLRQVECINKVQRLLQWHEIEFYCMGLFKVRWPEQVLFQNRQEFLLASGSLQSGEQQAHVSVWAVGGHVFSIESPSPLKTFSSSTDFIFNVATVAS